jgi:hypothetical protein
MSDSELPPADQNSPEPTERNEVPDLQHMDVIAIHMNELYNHLKKYGFDKEEALHLTGMVLSSGILFKYEDPFVDEPFDIEDDRDLGGEDFV